MSSDLLNMDLSRFEKFAGHYAPGGAPRWQRAMRKRSASLSIATDCTTGERAYARSGFFTNDRESS
jgi:hypothetical protein